MMRPKVDRENPMRLVSLVYTPDGEEVCEITPVQFQRMRPILAEQNGLTIPEEDANPELVEAEEVLRRQNAPELEISAETLVSAVAAISGAEEADIYDWPIKKLLNRQRAFQRILDYIICGVGEAQGTQWKRGNPTPSPFFDRKPESGAKVALSEFAGGGALTAVRNGFVQAQENETEAP